MPKLKTYYYYCGPCDEAWQDDWDCGCDSDCPTCGNTYTAFDSKRLRDAAKKQADREAANEAREESRASLGVK